VELGRSSGVPDLDRAALSQVTKWRFRPAIKDGNPIEVWAIVPVKFSLDRG
jgi:protein TonB